MAWLTVVEDKLETLVGALFRKAPAQLPHPAELAALLWKEALRQRRPARPGDCVPNYFIILLPPENLASSVSIQKMERQFADNLIRQAREYGLLLLAYPQVSLQPDPGLTRGEINLVADFRQEDPARAQQLLVRRGPQCGQVFPLHREQVVLGRSPACDYMIRDPNVSRRHALLERHHGLCHLTDLGSTNGVLVNDHQVREPVLLVPGDEITLGHTVLEFQVI